VRENDSKSLLLVVVASPISLFANSLFPYCPHKNYHPYGAFTLDVKSMLVLEERRGEERWLLLLLLL
jgi:hypothetical protein